MLLPKGGVSWKGAAARLPPSRSVMAYVFRTRFLLAVGLIGLIVFSWRGVSHSAADMQRFYCFGPSKSPLEMSPNEMSDWQGLNTPVIFNHHAPLIINETSIIHHDLNPIKATSNAISKQERVLLLTPLRDATPYLLKYFELLSQLSYPHELIDLAFLVGDTSDNTMSDLAAEVDRIQKRPEIKFRSVKIIEKDFGAPPGLENVQDKHGFLAQGPRRKAIARARNYLLYSALEPDHAWVYWRDVDIVDSPKPIVQDLMAHDVDVIVPNIWFHRYDGDNKDIEGRFDYNSWQETPEGLALANSLEPDTILAEGYQEYKTHRKWMAPLGNWRSDKDEEMDLDGVGGVNILVKADVHRSGINFPCYSFEHQAETEGFGKMAKRAGYSVKGLPNYVVWHIDTEEKAGNLGESNRLE